MYATIRSDRIINETLKVDTGQHFSRRKKSSSCQLQQGDEERSPQSQLFIPELINKLESEQTVHVKCEDHTQIGLLKPSQIKRFVSSQTKSSS